MQGWQTTYLGMRELPRDISGLEPQAFFGIDDGPCLEKPRPDGSTATAGCR